MTSKHTKGPWMAAAGPSGIVGWPIVGQMGRMIAEVTYIGRKPIGVSDQELKDYQAECKANAQLIAAAPDLLEALQLLQGLDFRFENTNADAEVRRRAVAAIAKAEGRS